MPTKTALVFALVFIAGCSTYTDPNISTTKPAGGVLGNGTSYFCQHTHYATRDGVNRGGEVLSHLLGFWQARDVVLVRFTSDSTDEFSAQYLDEQLATVDSRRFVKGADYQVDSDGAVQIKTSSRCGAGDSPGLGCAWSKIRLFTDPAGNLAVIQANDGAGTIGLIPVANSSRYLSLFPPVPLANGSLQDGIAQCPESRESKSRTEYQRQQVAPTFAVGDVVVQYRHYDSATKAWAPGPDEALAGTKWRVTEITDKHVRLELVAGEYKPAYAKGKAYKPGEFSTTFFSSRNYQTAKPYSGNIAQVFEEFSKDD